MYDKPIHRRSAATVSPETSARSAALIEQLIMPSAQELKSAEPLEIELVDTVAGLARLPLGGAVMAIANGPLLKMFLEYADLFNVRPVVLAGVPDVDYTAAWEQAVWGLDRATYGDLVTEMVSIDRVDAVMAKQGGSRQKPLERRVPEITKPRNKHYDDFNKHRVAGGDDMAGESDEGGNDES